MTPPDAHRDIEVCTPTCWCTPRDPVVYPGERFWTGPDRYRVILPVLSYEFQLGIYGYRPRTDPLDTRYPPGIHPGDVMMFIMMFIMMIS